jgi:uncharacterized membrane protein
MIAQTAAPEVIETTRLEWLSLPPVWVIVLVILPAVVLACRWLYRREPTDGGARWLPAILRGAVITLLLLFLFHPVRSKQRVRVERPVAAILLDDSASLREHDLADLAEDAGLTRDAERRRVVQAVLEDPIAELGEDYEVLLYSFGSSLRALGDLDDLAAADGETRLGDALAALAAEARGRELTQVVVVTDGRVNAGRDPLAALSALSTRQVPVHVLGVGDPEVPRDVRIANVTAPEVALAGDTVNLEVSVAARGYGGEDAQVTVTDNETKRELARADIRLPGEVGSSEAAEQLVRVSFVPEVEGDVDLLLELTHMPGEADDVNNQARRLLRVEPGRIKVLYVDGYPRYEYRFLRDSLLRVENMEVQFLLMSASEDYIQDSTDGVDALERLPTGLEYLLENYHVIILGDVHPQDLGADHEQFMADVKGFVEAGGGFLMLAGGRWSPREYAGTDIADILPVIIGQYDVEQGYVHNPGQPFRPELARPRDPHEIVSLLPDVEDNLELWQGEGGLAPLTWYYPVAKARSTAEAVLIHPQSTNSHGPHVILATMYHPQGRTAFMASDETWRWRFRWLETWREPFWRGLIRYLALNRLRRSDYRFDLSTDLSSYAIGERIGITARVRDTTFEPLVADGFEVTWVAPDGRRSTLELPREEPGVFGGSLLATDTGPYRFWLVDPDDATSTPRSPRIVTVTSPSLETDDAVLDELLLQRIAARSGGRYERLEDGPRLLASFDDPKRERPLDEPEREEVWAGFPQLSLLTLLLAAEWIVRKRRNLV